MESSALIMISDRMQICGVSNILPLNRTSQISKFFCIIPWILPSGIFTSDLELNTHMNENVRCVILMYNETGCHWGKPEQAKNLSKT